MGQEPVDFLNNLNIKHTSINFQCKNSKERKSMLLKNNVILQRQKWLPLDHTVQKVDQSSELLALKIRTRTCEEFKISPHQLKYFRYINDILLIWTGTKNELD